jgi:cytochrome c oxidase cbb3-type subunit 3
MSSVCRSGCVLCALGLAALLAAGCEREKRYFEKPLVAPNPVAQADAVSDLQPGEAGKGMRARAAVGGYSESNVQALAQGKMLYRWYNCTGCHAQGGGGIGPALMDDQWIYGSRADDIFATIMEGRPNGMPSFRGRIPEEQAWQIVAYVRSMSGLVASGVAPNRSDGFAGALPEAERKARRPDEKK